MAIDIHTREVPISPHDARNFIQQETDDFGVFFDVDRCYELTAILMLDMKDCTIKARRLANNPNLMLDKKEDCIDALVRAKVPQAKFIDMRTGKPSCTSIIRKSIIDDITSTDEAKQLCELMNTYASAKRNKGNIENFAIKNPQSSALSKLNHRMSIGHPTWAVLSTSRISAKDPGVQGIPREMSDIICEPKGYTLVRADSGQIEPRINFSTFLHDELIANLITKYDDAYFGLLHYCVMPPDREEPLRQNFEANFKPLNITDEVKALRQNLKTLSLAGSYGSSNLDKVNANLAAAFERRIVKHPARLSLEQQVREQVKHGQETFYGYFGTPVTPDATERYAKNDTGWFEHVVRCGINNPVQTTASELMMFSVDKAKEILSRAKDSHICFYKHDEACFYVSDEDMASGIGDELADVTAYNVDGWIPIHAEAVIGVKKGSYPSYI